MTPTATTPAPKSPARTAATSDLPSEVRSRIDADIAVLQAGERTWVNLSLAQRARLLQRVRKSVAAAAEDWAHSATTMKGLSPQHPLAGEEWLSGPYAVLVALDALIGSLQSLARGASPIDGLAIGSAPGDRVRIPTFPLTAVDGLLLSGFTGEVWLRPGVTAADAQRRAGLAQLDPTVSGGVGLVLGAGNVTSIPVLDAFYELIAHNRVVIIKLNPTMETLQSVFERALAPLIEPGLVRIVTGDGAVGGYLTGHPDIAHVHITGSAATFDAIVWGTGATATRRRRENRPQLTKPITAELGGVSPIIVVPGEWTAADLRYQAEHIATMRLQNAGHNCIAGQVVVISSSWPQREDFIAELRSAYSRAPQRAIWYPHASERLDRVMGEYPVAERLAGGTRVFVALDEGADATALETTEYFAPVLGVIELDGSGQEFLDNAVAHANDRLQGTLGANVLVDPATLRALGDGFERAMARLHYGTIAINAWTAFGFLTPTVSWGAYPGSTLEDVGSGIGIVHNALLLDDVERSVIRGPFRPFPRSLTGGEKTVLPKPPWFVSSRTGAAVSEGFARFRMTGSWPKLLVTLTQAFRA